jgi:hypothetical protein
MKITNKLGNYLALTLGAGAAATSAEAATTVTFYGAKDSPPAGISPGSYYGGFRLDSGATFNDSKFAVDNSSGGMLFTSGGELGNRDSDASGYFTAPGTSGSRGAQNGDANYVNISLNGSDGVFESVGQFHIGSDNIRLIALAKNDDNSALSISAGKTAIEAASTSAVPEVSSHLALLALGSAGVLTRRRLKRAA